MTDKAVTILIEGSPYAIEYYPYLRRKYPHENERVVSLWEKDQIVDVFTSIDEAVERAIEE